jgi:hypothetical protein
VYRLLVCLPLCLVLEPQRPEALNPNVPLAPAAAAQEPLPVKDPLAFLEKGLERYRDKGIQGYTAILRKQERINGRLQPSEDIEVFFREQPHSALLRWKKGQRKAKSALYVEGQNDGKMLAQPAGVGGLFVKVVSRDPEGADAKESGRYTLKEFGIKKGTERVLKAWKAAKEKGTLQVEYLGVREVREAGNRLCYTLRRTCQKPEEDDISQVTVYIDKETWLQVGTVLKQADGVTLVGEYMFKDIQLNPKFKADQFDASALTR